MRHAYWRRPDTKLHKANNEQFAPTTVIEELGKRATVQSDGSVTWPYPFVEEHRLVTCSSICILDPDGRELNESDAFPLIEGAANELIRKQGSGVAVKASELLTRVEKKASEFFHKEVEEYTMVTSLSIKGFMGDALDVFGCQIACADRRAFQFPKAASDPKSFLAAHVENSKYAPIKVATKGITINQALDRALTSVNVLRGVWNLIATFRSNPIRWTSYPERKWIGVIHLGPIHTFHKLDGKLVDEEMYWFEPDYVADVALYTPKVGWKKVESYREDLFGKIAESPFTNELLELLNRYATALDQANLDVTFLMLWGLLERLTNTVGGNYDETIRRAVRPFSDRLLSKQFLNQMRRQRNHFVHAARSSEERDKLCYITKSFVDQHLIFALENSYSVNTLEEHGDFLALPKDKVRLTKMRDWYQRALDEIAAAEPEDAASPDSVVISEEESPEIAQAENPD